jgi:hypothetical protein
MRSPTSSTWAVAALTYLVQLGAAQNVAFNKTVWVSSVLAPYDGPFAVDELFSVGSRWISDTTLNHALVIDLADV